MLSDDDMTRIARRLSAKKAREFYNHAPATVSQLYTKSAYIAIYQIVTMELLKAGMSDSEMYSVTGLSGEVVSAMLRAGFRISVNFDTSI